MIWVLCIALALATLLPLLLVLRPSTATITDRREADVALYRAQTEELTRDLEQGRISAAEHSAAAAEVARRLLSANAAPTRMATLRTASLPILLAFTLVPALGFGLYLYQGHPEIVGALEVRAEQTKLIAQLRTAVERQDQTTERTRQGWILLGNAERTQQNYAATADAYKRALAIRFEAELSFQIGTMLMAANNDITDETRDYYRRALEAAPADAPWRPMAEQLLSRDSGTTERR